GHPRHERVASPTEALNGGSFEHRLDSCPACGDDLRPALTIAPRVVQPGSSCRARPVQLIS
ncbi:MAG TPA: hypothetical protein VKP69_30380, partial [Isosphaeraceae bacterium]|nr:hypothetical protein [Isosphaeraceae bacterium]